MVSILNLIESETNRYAKSFYQLLYSEGYKLVKGKYITNKQHVIVQCPNEHKPYKVRPDNFKTGKRCPDCKKEKLSKTFRKTQKQFEQEIYKLYGNEYTVISEYVNADSYIRMKHNNNKCNNYEWEVIADSFLRGHKCPKCADIDRGIKLRKTTDEFKKELYNLVGYEYSLIGKYKTAIKKVTLKHNVCNYLWEVSPNSFLGGNRCPACSESKGERSVAGYLDKIGLEYERYKTFDDLKHIRKLECDFYLPDYNLIIEFDGIQHFESVKHFGGEDNLKITQKRDQLKNEYAKKKKINMLRIPYWELENVDFLIEQKLSSLTYYGKIIY